MLVNPAGTGIDQIAAPRTRGKIARHWMVIFTILSSRRRSLQLFWLDGVAIASREVRFKTLRDCVLFANRDYLR